jgi:XapX domain-containing protein
MMTSLVGLAQGAIIGAGCRWFDLPLPAPPRITGALLVVSMTLGFILADAGITHWEMAA